MYEIFIRDHNLKRSGQITDFIKLDLNPRFNAVGSFVLDIPTNCDAARELIKPKYGIIVKKDGKTILSGTVTGRKRDFSSSGDTLTLVGKDDNAYLAGRLVYPVPGGDFTLASYDVRTGKAETIMKEYVDVNLGLNALTDRRKVTIEPDKGLGSTVTGRGRFHNMIDFLSSIALNGGGLGFKVVQVNDSLEFQVYQPEDKTRSAFFSPLLGNLSSFSYSNDNPTANLIIVGGGGEGNQRLLLQKSDSSSIAEFERWESFQDRRDTTEIEELNQALDEGLLNQAEQNTFSFTPIDTPQLAFGEHYGLGDKVSIVLTMPNEKVTVETFEYFISAYQTFEVETERIQRIQQKFDVIQDVVREVKITIGPNGDTIQPVVGTAESNNNSILGIFGKMNSKMNKALKRLSHLERM